MTLYGLLRLTHDPPIMWRHYALHTVCTYVPISGFKPRTGDHTKVKAGVQVPIINAVSRPKGQR